MNSLTKWFEEFVNNAIIRLWIAIVASSGITALISKEPFKVLFKNVLAGLLAGLLAYIICKTTNTSETTKLIICSVSTGFISSLWPILGNIGVKILKKKTDVDISSN